MAYDPKSGRVKALKAITTADLVENGGSYTLDPGPMTVVMLVEGSLGGAGGTLDGLTDVTILSVADGEILMYDNATGEWINATLAEAGISAVGHTHTESEITDLSHTDPAAIHDNVAGEIAAITEKVSPVTNDFLLLEDSEDSNNKKHVKVGNISGSSTLDGLTDVTILSVANGEVLMYDSGSGEWINATLAEAGIAPASHTHTESEITDLSHTDPDAIHDNVNNEIAVLTEKTVPTTADKVLIEDSENSNAKRMVQLGNLPGLNTNAVVLLFAQVLSQTIANTTTETDLLALGRGSKVILGGTLESGTSLRISLEGILGDTGAPSPTLSIKMGTTTLVSVTPTLSGVTDVKWQLNIMISCRASGVSGSIQAAGLFDYDEGSEIALSSASPVTVDTTVDQELKVTWTWDVADSLNTITSRQGWLELLSASGFAPVAPTELGAVQL